MFKHILLAAALALPLTAAFAEDAKQPTAQQQKMSACNKEAGDKKLAGDERKKFMSTCLSATGAPAEPKKDTTSQQQKMTTCNKDAGAKKLTGDERKKFMSECLKG